MASVPIHDMSATEMARRIREGTLSPVTVVDALLERIHDRNDRTNAFVTVTDERARESARDAARAVEDGEPLGPLHGVPVAIKDLTDVAGVTTTRGSKLFEDAVAETNAVVVDRLLAAGAVVIGKTNTPEFGLGCTTDNRVVGPTGTPFAPERIAGGSSGGSAAALADRLVPIAQGSDAGGSIRTPAACCGIYGFKPTFGRVPIAGRPNAFGHHSPFIHVGPMTRSVEDAALLMEVMAGPHPRDPFSLPDGGDRYADAAGGEVDDLTVAYSPDLGTYPVSPSVRDVVDDAVEGFAEAGATVERADPPLDLDNDEILDTYYTFATVLWRTLFDGLAEEHGLDPYGADRDALAATTVETALEAEDVSTREYKAADRARTRVYDAMMDLLEDYDVLVTPTLAVPPFPIGEFPTEVEGRSIEPRRGWLLTQPFNLTGQPVASVPAGFTDDGLPVGMQVVGRRLADADVLRASAAFERARPWADRYPN